MERRVSFTVSSIKFRSLKAVYALLLCSIYTWYIIFI